MIFANFDHGLCGYPGASRQSSALLILLIALSNAALAGTLAQSQGASESVPQGAAQEVVELAVGQSTILVSPVPLKRVYVSNPALVQSYTQGQNEVVITAKAAGMSTLICWDTTGHRQHYSIVGNVDVQSLRTALSEGFPGATIRADTAGGKILLSGEVPNDAASDAALKMASAYSKDVVNFLRVVAPRTKQVELKLRIVEVDRTKLEQFGVNLLTAGKNSSSISTQQFASPTFNNPIGTGAVVGDALNLAYFNLPLGVGVTIKDLEDKQILQVLAEPTLTTMSGLPARFLSGGEFPFPVVQGGIANSTAITIMFRPYGVKVDFTPTVNADGSIRLKVNPEVSTLDYTNAVTISGFTIPALSTRRAETEVEIRDGQSFVVSGLLDHRTTDSLSKIPGIAGIPILGQFFKSKNFSHSVVELVVIVTASVVDPIDHPRPVREPQMIVPNMDSKVFDENARKAIEAAPPNMKVLQK